MSDALSSFNLRATPQTEKARPDQVMNAAGGAVFAVTPLIRLRRFLTLGTSGGSYYVGEHDLTRDTAQVVVNYAETDPEALVQEIVAVSQAGRAPKNDQALFALAIAASLADDDGKKMALAALPLVARTGTHLFQFAGYVEQFRGWGRGLRKAVGAWYTDKPVPELAYQVAKYQNRQGWGHRDLLRLSHPATDTASRKALFDWVCGRDADLSELPIIEAFVKAHEPGTNLPELILNTQGLSWEMLPSERLNDADVWAALLAKGLPQTALMRQLPRLTNLGLLSPFGDHLTAVTAQLTDMGRLRSARVHPINVLIAQRTYSGGQSLRGSSTWTPVSQVTDALDTAFYQAFGAVPSTNQRHLLALDVSGSMTQAVSGMPLSCREASAALALVTANVEPKHQIVGFTAGAARTSYSRYGSRWADNTALTPLNISSRMRLNDAISVVSRLSFGGTDCALPITEALKNKTVVDVFSVYTDNETWAGSIHPFQALRQYREQVNPLAKLVVVGMTSSPFSIADPSDAGMLDIAGFDSATPNLIADFARGDL